MRTTTLTLLAAILLAGALAAQPKTDQPKPPATAPYFTSLTEAEQAATANQDIVIEFYTDW